jgi:hypothetical protein
MLPTRRTMSARARPEITTQGYRRATAAISRLVIGRIRAVAGSDTIGASVPS